MKTGWHFVLPFMESFFKNGTDIKLLARKLRIALEREFPGAIIELSSCLPARVFSLNETQTCEEDGTEFRKMKEVFNKICGKFMFS